MISGHFWLISSFYFSLNLLDLIKVVTKHSAQEIYTKVQADEPTAEKTA